MRLGVLAPQVVGVVRGHHAEPQLLAEPQFKNLMIDEAHVAMRLLHSNIVQVLDLGEAKGRYYLVLEFVDGWDLNNVLNRVRATGFPMPPELALFVVAEVGRALAYAHAVKRDGQPMGIVHRDVSPHNVLLSDQGEVKLTDFGIAKALTRRGENTVQGVIKGKLAFMSPEQASGTAVDFRSDLFSLGTLLYLMTTGRRPFESPTDLEALLRVQKGEFPPPEVVKPDIDPALAEGLFVWRSAQSASANAATPRSPNAIPNAVGPGIPMMPFCPPVRPRHSTALCSTMNPKAIVTIAR